MAPQHRRAPRTMAIAAPNPDYSPALAVAITGGASLVLWAGLMQAARWAATTLF